MLRGWNKYDLDPLGGSRVVYNSLDYRYGMFDVFYDTGAIWDPGQDSGGAAFGRRGAAQELVYGGDGFPGQGRARDHQSLWSV